MHRGGGGVKSRTRSIRLRYDTEENVGTFAARCRHVLRLICGAFGGLRIARPPSNLAME